MISGSSAFSKMAAGAVALRRHREAERKYPTFKFRGGRKEELPHVQAKELWLRFAEAAVKTYPTSKVRKT